MTLGLRSRVALWSTAANGLALAVGMVVLSWVVDQHLTGAFDEELASQAEATASGVETSLETEPSDPITRIGSEEVQTGLHKLFTPSRDVPQAFPVMVSLLDNRGQRLLATHTPNAVDFLVAEIHRITERGLSVRVPLPPARDEIRRLSETFNAMLDRLDRGFPFQTRPFPPQESGAVFRIELPRHRPSSS